MRLSHKMEKVIAKVRNNEPYRLGAGNFLIDGAPITRTALSKGSSFDISKVIYCGTCGGLLCHESNPSPNDIVPEIPTCAKCKQTKVYDSGYDDEPEVVQLFQDWRLGRVAIQRDIPKETRAPAPAPPTPPLVLEQCHLYDALHPINLNRSPVRRNPDGSLHNGTGKSKGNGKISDRADRVARDVQQLHLHKTLGQQSVSHVRQSELIGELGWFSSMQQLQPGPAAATTTSSSSSKSSSSNSKSALKPSNSNSNSNSNPTSASLYASDSASANAARASSPSKSYFKFVNGFGTEREYKQTDRTLEQTQRFLLTSAGSDRRVKVLQTATLSKSRQSYIGLQFNEQQWSGFHPHDAAKQQQHQQHAETIARRKMRPNGAARQDAPHFIRNLKGKTAGLHV